MDNKLSKIVGQRINERLAQKDIKQKNLAEKLGVTDNTISYYCSGKRLPSTAQIRTIANFLECSTDYILGIEKEPTTDKDVQFICNYTGLSEKAINSLHEYNTSFSFFDFLDRWNDISFKDGFTGEDIIDTENQSVTFDKADVINSLFIELSKNKTAFYKQFVQSVHDYHIAIKSSIHLMNEYLPVLKTRVQQLKDDSSMDYLLPEDEKALIINKLDMPMRYSRYDLQDLSNDFINGYFSKEIAEYKKLSAEYTPLYNEMMKLQRTNGKGGKHGNNTETQ